MNWNCGLLYELGKFAIYVIIHSRLKALTDERRSCSVLVWI